MNIKTFFNFYDEFKTWSVNEQEDCLTFLTENTIGVNLPAPKVEMLGQPRYIRWIQCPICGKEFNSHYNQRYCSKSCAGKARRGMTYVRHKKYNKKRKVMKHKELDNRFLDDLPF